MTAFEEQLICFFFLAFFMYQRSGKALNKIHQDLKKNEPFTHADFMIKPHKSQSIAPNMNMLLKINSSNAKTIGCLVEQLDPQSLFSISILCVFIVYKISSSLWMLMVLLLFWAGAISHHYKQRWCRSRICDLYNPNTREPRLMPFWHYTEVAKRVVYDLPLLTIQCHIMIHSRMYGVHCVIF